MATDSIEATNEIYRRGLNDQTLSLIYAGQYADTFCMTGAKADQDMLYVFNDGRLDENKSRSIVHDRILKILDETMQSCDQAVFDAMAGRTMEEIEEQKDREALAVISKAGAVRKWCNGGKNEARISKFMTSICYQEKYRHVHKEFNASNTIFALPNGSLIIDRGAPKGQRIKYIKEMMPEALSTQVFAVPYEEGAVNKDFEDYLREAVSYEIDGTRHDGGRIEELYNTLIMFLGYCMLRGNPDQIVMLWIGKGGSGRSTIAEIMTKTMGEYAKKGRKEMVIKNESGRIIADTALLAPKHFTYCDEFNHNDVLDGAEIRSLTDEELFVEKKGKDPYTARVNFTPLLISNFELRMESSENSILRRIYVMRFYREVQDKDIIVRMSDRIFNAGPSGILNTLIKGLSMYLDAENFKSLIPKYIRDESKEFVQSNDPMQEFLNNYMKKTKNRDDIVKLTQLDNMIKTFYERRGEDAPYKHLRSLATLLRNHQYDVYSGHGGASYIRGITLEPLVEEEDIMAVAREKEKSVMGRLGELDKKILDIASKHSKQPYEIFGVLKDFEEKTIDKRIKVLAEIGELQKYEDGSYIKV